MKDEEKNIEELSPKEKMKLELLDNLSSAVNQKTTRFSASRNKVNSKKKETNRLFANNEEEVGLTLANLEIQDKPIQNLLSDKDWDDMMDMFDELSPIDDITYEDRMRYKRKTNGDKYDDMFSKEQSMLNDLLSGLQKKSKAIDKKLESMTGKGVYGVGKNYADLVSASNSIETTKLSVIKELVGIKKTAVDLRLKDEKLKGTENEVEDNDTVADRFYKSILKGQSRDFIESSMAGFDSSVGMQNYNISQPFSGGDYEPDDYDNESADKYGYIVNEGKNAKIVLCQYDDGTGEFVALDDNNHIVPNYELPSPELIDTIKIKPGGSFAYDEYGRSYKIISPDEISYDEQTMYVPIDDIDDCSEEDVNTDDKYDYDDDDDYDYDTISNE